MRSVERANQLNTKVRQGTSIQEGDEFGNCKAAKPYRASTGKGNVNERLRQDRKAVMSDWDKRKVNEWRGVAARVSLNKSTLQK
jgi:hypothetical protein